MFNFFNKPEYKMPKVSEVEPKEPKICYSIGATAEGTHVAFTLGYSTLTMNKTGCQQLIDQLEVFKNQLVVKDD